jgi:hypothetical protein
MQISRVFRAIKILAVPLLFSAAVLGLATVHLSLQRKGERAKNRAAGLIAAHDGSAPNGLIGIKLQDLSAEVAKGDLPAQIEMGRRLARGQGVKKDEAQAARHFQAVISQVGEIGARDKRAPLVATAFRYLAQFHRHGVVEAKIPANPAFAFDLLLHAASYFGDPESQYELAKLLMTGDGVTKNPRAAAQWLLSASRKGHAPSQALLGEMLWRGNGVTRVAGDGLGLLAIARRNASPEDKVWVSKMFETARAEALPIEILEANAFIVQETSASHFGGAGGTLIDGEAPEPIAGAASAGFAGEGAISRGNSQALSSLRASPMVYGSDAASREVSAEKNDAKVPAGILQMYRPLQIEARDETPVPVRFAGVSK